MKRWSYRTWVKIVTGILCIISGVACTGCTIGIAMLAEVKSNYSTKELERTVYQRMASNYASMMISRNENNDDSSWDMLDGGNLEYLVQEEKAKQVTDLYSNSSDVSEEDYQYIFKAKDNTTYTFSTSSLWGIMTDHVTGSPADSSYTEEEILGYVLDTDNNVFYCETPSKYIMIYGFAIQLDNYIQEFYWDEQRAEYLTLDTRKGIELYDKSLWECFYPQYSYTDEDGIAIDDLSMLSANQMDAQKEIFTDENFFISEGYVEYNDRNMQTVYTVYMKLKEPLQKGRAFHIGIKDFFYDAQNFLSHMQTFEQCAIYFQVGSLAVFVISFVILSIGAGHRITEDEIHLRWVDKMPYAVLAGLVIASVCTGIAVNVQLISELARRLSLSTLVIFELEVLAVWSLLALILYLSTITRLKAHKFWRYTICYFIMAPFRNAGRRFFTQMKNLREASQENVSLMWKTIFIWGGLSFIQLLVIIITGYSPTAEVWWFILYKLIEGFVVFWCVMQMKRIKEAGKRIAQGDYSQPIKTNGMYWEFKHHAENINQVSNGISVAVEKQMKSEHFKTELITNVSHDIKTPLTSIINYVDLIKKEDVDNETVREYVDVLDRQSARLKKLIEDLMEASKASTGNLSVHLEKVDVNVMLSQVVGEFEEKLQAGQLDLIVTNSNLPLYIMADGRHLWRVFDNLLSNVCKYAQPGTRVYVDLENREHQICIVFRNISKYQLNISSEELLERFVRGDSSRNTEGNGLGLSIAQSLTNLMNGQMRLDVDGDLFKVTVSFTEVMEPVENPTVDNITE